MTNSSVHKSENCFNKYVLDDIVRSRYVKINKLHRFLHENDDHDDNKPNSFYFPGCKV